MRKSLLTVALALGLLGLGLGRLAFGGDDRVLGDDVEGQGNGDVGVELNGGLVFAEGLHRSGKMDALLVDLEAGGDELVVQVVGW
jgi:hypothetical protein